MNFNLFAWLLLYAKSISWIELSWNMFNVDYSFTDLHAKRLLQAHVYSNRTFILHMIFLLHQFIRSSIHSSIIYVYFIIKTFFLKWNDLMVFYSVSYVSSVSSVSSFFFLHRLYLYTRSNMTTTTTWNLNNIKINTYSNEISYFQL